jgi:deoxyribonuclease-1-like protein
VPRGFSILLLAAIFGGGWYYMQPPESRPKLPFNLLQQMSGPNAPMGQGGPITAQYPAPMPVMTQSAAAMNSSQAVSPQMGGPTIRIASYNIQVFGNEKVDQKPYIAAELARVIRNFHIVAIQEIRSKDDYLLDRFLHDYVNAGSDRRYDYVIGPRLGRSSSKEQYAFIYDTTAVEVNKQSIYTVNDPQDLLHREPLVALFRAKGPSPYEAFTFVLVDIHTDPDETKEELDALADVYRAVRQASNGEDDIIILGDLNVDDHHLGRLGQIPGIRPVLSGVYSNTKQNALYDNIILHQPSTAEFTGRCGVYDVQRMNNLTQEQALQVSDHFPIWAEFSVYESAAPGRVAGRAAAEPAYATPQPR